MRVHQVRLLLTVPLIWVAIGCLGPRRNDYHSSGPMTVVDPSPQADRIWDSAQEALRQHRFRLDRLDRRAGIITTMPETSQSLVEFWRHDVDTWPDLWEATLNPIRRWVEVIVSRGEDGRWVELEVVVHKERLSSPDRQFNSTGAAYQYFGGNLPSTAGAVEVTPEEDVWLDLGRDPAMEELLLNAIFESAGLGANPEPPADGG